MLDVDFWKNEKISNIESFVVIKNLSRFGGNFKALYFAHFFICFMLFLSALFLIYIHRIKFKDNYVHHES